MKTPNYQQMQDMFRAHTEAAVKVIVEIMNGSGGKGDAVRLSAAKEILTRGWGKPAGQDKKAKLPPADSPEYHNKALTQIVAEEAAAEGRDPPWDAALAAQSAAELPRAAETVKAPAAAPPVPPPAVQAARADDPTGYKARRALWSAPANAAKS